MKDCLRWLLGIAALMVGTHAGADLSIRVDFDEGIAPPMRAAVEHLIELELRAPMSERSREGTTLVTVQTVPDSSLVRIKADDAITGKTLSRTVDRLALGANGSTRLLALAIVELLTASWAELETNPRPFAAPVGPHASADERSSALATVHARGSERRGTQVSGLGVVDGMFGGTGAMAGGGVRIVPELPHHLALPIDLTELHGTRSFAIGDVTIDALSIDVSLVYEKRWGRLGLRAGAGGRVGAVRFGAHATRDTVVASSIWSASGGPVASISGVVAATRRLAVELLLEGGYGFARTEARAEGTTRVGYDGPWIGAGLSVGVFAGRLR